MDKKLSDDATDEETVQIRKSIPQDSAPKPEDEFLPDSVKISKDNSPEREEEPNIEGMKSSNFCSKYSSIICAKMKECRLTFQSDETEAFWVYDKIIRKKFLLILLYILKLSHVFMSAEEQSFIKEYGLLQPGVCARFISLITMPITIYVMIYWNQQRLDTYVKKTLTQYQDQTEPIRSIEQSRVQ